MKLILLPLRLTWTLFVILTPLLGVWVASSLAAYLNGPIWVACVAGAVLFPVGPLLWELRGTSRWKRKQERRKEQGKGARERILTFWDRMVLRTLFINLLFLGSLLATFPQQGFTALSTRGDWMLQTRASEEADIAREYLFGAASRLEWLYTLSKENPYKDLAPDDGHPEEEPDPNQYPDEPERPEKPEPPKTKETPEKPEKKTEEPNKKDSFKIESPKQRQPGEPPTWPMPERLHPLVRDIPADVQRDYKEVARYIAAREKDPFLRVKALHDYVADNISYDFPSLNDGSYIYKQKVDQVWQTKTGVCAGYAKLMVAMGEVTGDKIVYVTGDARDLGGNVDGAGHAWNAVKIEGRWYLMDVTWDAGGSQDGKTFNKEYSTTYLFTPPSAFGLDHHPDNDAWQLRKPPMNRGEFIRQPLMRPSFYALGMELVSPRRSQIDVSGDAVVIKLENKPMNKISAVVGPKGGSSSKRCTITGKEDVTLTCPLERSGTYLVQIFATPDQTAMSLPFVGQIEVNH